MNTSVRENHIDFKYLPTGKLIESETVRKSRNETCQEMMHAITTPKIKTFYAIIRILFLIYIF